MAMEGGRAFDRRRRMGEDVRESDGCSRSSREAALYLDSVDVLGWREGLRSDAADGGGNRGWL